VTDHPVGTLDIEPLTPVRGATTEVWTWLAGHPVTFAAAALAAAASAVLPLGRRATPFGVAAIGFVVVGSSVLAGASVPSTIVGASVWAVAGISSVAIRRSS
jgi:hypothetical protein